MGSGPSMAATESGQYSRESRKCITGVAAAKLIDIFGSLPSVNIKQKVAVWLSEILGLEATAFFDQKTHKGYLCKALENRRRKNADEKKWTWSKKARLAINADSDRSASMAATTSSESTDLELDGCPRNVADCAYCGGKYWYLSSFARLIMDCGCG